MTLDADIDLIFVGCGDTFTAGGVSRPCLATFHDEVQGASADAPGQVIGLGYALVRTSSFPDLATGDVVAVRSEDADESVNYRAAQLMRLQDGRVTQVFLGAM